MESFESFRILPQKVTAPVLILSHKLTILAYFSLMLADMQEMITFTAQLATWKRQRFHNLDVVKDHNPKISKNMNR